MFNNEELFGEKKILFENLVKQSFQDELSCTSQTVPFYSTQTCLRTACLLQFTCASSSISRFNTPKYAPPRELWPLKIYLSISTYVGLYIDERVVTHPCGPGTGVAAVMRRSQRGGASPQDGQEGGGKTRKPWSIPKLRFSNGTPF